jgi:hypothetical protein
MTEYPVSTALCPASTDRPRTSDTAYASWVLPLIHTLAEKSCYQHYKFFDSDEIVDGAIRAVGEDPNDQALSRLKFGNRTLRGVLQDALYIYRIDHPQRRTDPYFVHRWVDPDGKVLPYNFDPEQVPFDPTAVNYSKCKTPAAREKALDQAKEAVVRAAREAALKVDKAALKAKTGKAAVIQYALREVAIKEAITHRPRFMQDASGTVLDRRNVTNIWLDGQLKHHDLYNRLVNALTFDPTTCKEREDGVVLDHVNHFLVTAIRRDSFRTRLETCDPPPFRQIREWCLRATYTTFHRRAQDPLFRESHGARTGTERRASTTAAAKAKLAAEAAGLGEAAVKAHAEMAARIASTTPEAMIASDFTRVIETYDCLRSEEQVATEVIVDQGATHRELHRLDFSIGMDKVRLAFCRHKPGNHDRMLRVFGLMSEGWSVEDIGHLVNVPDEQRRALLAKVDPHTRRPKFTPAQVGAMHGGGVSRNRAATLMADCRAALRDAKQASDDAITLLRYLTENPFSTLADIEADITTAGGVAAYRENDNEGTKITTPIVTKAPTLLAGLIASGSINSRKATSRDGESVKCYLVTERGTEFLANRSNSVVSSDDIIDRLSL